MTEKLRIVLLCDNILRELVGLQLLQKELQQKLKADVHIIGSIAEIQRTYFELAQIKPHVVFISQILEKDCRAIAEYAKKSGALVCVLPMEVTPAQVVKSIIVNPDLMYNHLLDALFLPGQKMYSYFDPTDIDPHKMKISGSPKIDAMFGARGIPKKEFFTKHHLDSKKPTIFIFTSFPRTDLAYFKSDKGFANNMKLMKRVHTAIRETGKAYLKELPKICEALPSVSIVLKPHPLEDVGVYDYLQQYSNFHIITTATVADCIQAMDVAVHWNSTVCTEFWLHNIPTLQFTPLKKHDWILSDFSLGNPIFHDRNLLIKAISKQLVNKATLSKKCLAYQKYYFAHNFFKVDGKSSQRIGIELKKLLANNAPQVSYKQKVGLSFYAIKIVEKIVGVKLSRWLIAQLTGAYNWQYAVDNYVHEY